MIANCGWLNDAARDRMKDDDLARVLNELFPATGGPLAEAELTRAPERITHAER